MMKAVLYFSGSERIASRLVSLVRGRAQRRGVAAGRVDEALEEYRLTRVVSPLVGHLGVAGGERRGIARVAGRAGEVGGGRPVRRGVAVEALEAAAARCDGMAVDALRWSVQRCVRLRERAGRELASGSNARERKSSSRPKSLRVGSSMLLFKS